MSQGPGRPRRTGPRTVSIRDVAVRAGVSDGTVSNYLNRPERVRPATQERIRAAIADLGFVRNESARQLRVQRSRTVAFVTADASDPFYVEVARGAQEVARRDGRFVTIWETGGDERRTADCVTMLVEQRVGGVLLGAVSGNLDPARALADRGMPVVVVGVEEPVEHVCSLSTDDRHGGRLAMRHLLGLGHRRVTFAGGSERFPFVPDRIAGARDALAELTGAGPTGAGGATAPDAPDLRVHATGGVQLEDGRVAARALVALPVEARPTAVLCANDLVAMGLIQVLLQAGLRVPRDVAVVGYDDVRFAEVSLVPVTTVRQPGRLLGRRACELLTAAAEPDHVHESTQFKPELVVRASTGGVRRGGGAPTGR